MNERTQTPQRVERLREELNRLIHDQLPLAIESIQGACQSPDFSGSLAYAHSAQRRWFGESRIAELKNKLVKSEMTGAGNGHEISRVVFGAVVTLRMEPQGETVRYRLVSEDEADISTGTMSVSAPLARALLGREEDEVIEVETPSGLRTYRILEIRYSQ